MALKLDIIANTQQFVKEMKRGGASVEEISDALDQMAKDATKSGDKGERSFKDLAKAADKSADSIGDDYKRGFDKAERGAEDFKSESHSTAKEVAASFDGSAESIAEGFQEVAANALSGFGPAGAAAGIALAAGIGIASAAFTGMQEQSEATKQLISDNFQEMADNGIAAWASMEEQNKRLSDAYDQHATEIQNIADIIGLPFEVVAAAWAGNEEAIGRVRAAQQSTLDELSDGATVAEQAIVQGVTKPLDDVVGAYDKAKEKAKQYEAQVGASESANRDQIQRTQDKTLSAADAMRAAIEGRPITATVEVDDRALRNYRPPVFYIEGRIIPNGQSQVI